MDNEQKLVYVAIASHGFLNGMLEDAKSKGVTHKLPEELFALMRMIEDAIDAVRGAGWMKDFVKGIKAIRGRHEHRSKPINGDHQPPDFGAGHN